MHSFSKIGALAAALASLAAAQTFSACNPMTNTSCAPNPAMCSDFSTDFTQGASAMSGWKTTAGNVTFGSDGAQFTINQRGDAPTIQTDDYFFFGYVEVKMKSSKGTGIISSIVLESDDLDEVDWEFLGGDNGNVQTNYFGKGNTTTFDRMIQFPVTTPQQTSHTFAVNWTQEAMVWLIDGTAVRTLNFADAVGGKNFPQTPMNLRIGIWAGGDPSNNAGTISWAGGETDYTQAPFTMTVESVKVVNYNPGKEYEYTDQTGSFQSIKTVAGTCGSTTNSTGATSNSGGGAAGGFYPEGSSVSGASSGDKTCTKSTMTVTVTEGENPTPAPETTFVQMTSYVTSPVTVSTAQTLVPSSLMVDTGSPTVSVAVSTVAPQSNITIPAASATSASPTQFTGAAIMARSVDGSTLGLTSLLSIILGLLAL